VRWKIPLLPPFPIFHSVKFEISKAFICDQIIGIC